MFSLNLAPICSEVSSNFTSIEIALSGCEKRVAGLITADPCMSGMDASQIRRIIGRTDDVRNCI